MQAAGARSTPSVTGSQGLILAFASTEPEFPVRVFFLATDGEEGVSDEHGTTATDMDEVERVARDGQSGSDTGTSRKGDVRRSRGRAAKHLNRIDCENRLSVGRMAAVRWVRERPKASGIAIRYEMLVPTGPSEPTY